MAKFSLIKSLGNLFPSRKKLDQQFALIKEGYLELEDKNSKKLYNDFLDRYKKVLENRLNLSNFLIVEKTILQRIQTQVSNNQEAQRALKAQKAEKSSKINRYIVDQMVEDQMNRILGYPRVDLPENASHEVAHLYGAIFEFQTNYWEAIGEIIRESITSGEIFILPDLERRLFLLVSQSLEEIPYALKTYRAYLNDPNTKLDLLNQESQNALKLAAFFLAEVSKTMKNALTRGSTHTDTPVIIHQLKQILQDFRLNNLQRVL